MTDDGEDADRLRRWEDLGGVWRVLSGRSDRVVVSLCRCDAGEEVDRIVSADQELIDYLAGRSSNEEAAG
jgi:hypothetical protein